MIIDALVLASVTYAVRRGRKRGLTGELSGAASIVLFFVTGCGLFKWMYRGLSEASVLTGQSLGVLTFIGLIVASVALWRKMKVRLGTIAGKLVTAERQRLAGGIAGGVRAFILAATLLLNH